jgi:hypothetical protein
MLQLDMFPIPVPVWYFPASQSMHDPDVTMPSPLWYLPAWQSVQFASLIILSPV